MSPDSASGVLMPLFGFNTCVRIHRAQTSCYDACFIRGPSLYPDFSESAINYIDLSSAELLDQGSQRPFVGVKYSQAPGTIDYDRYSGTFRRGSDGHIEYALRLPNQIAHYFLIGSSSDFL